MHTFVPSPVADRLADLVRSLGRYNLLSNGVEEQIRQIIPEDLSGIARLDEDEIADRLFRVVNVLLERRLEPVLLLHDLPHPRYPVGGREEDPAQAPPVWEARPSKASPGGWTVLGHDVGFPVGIPSCELTRNADWVEYYARQGFHILTYRTVRNKQKPGSPYDWVFLDGIQRPWDPSAVPAEVRRADGPVPRDWRAISTATSFVAPSVAPEQWEVDVRDARGRLDAMGGHHLLIVSVTDSVAPERKSPETLAADFAEVATRAEAAGAQAIECYLARASARDARGGLAPCERDTETSIAIVRQVRSVLRPDTSLLIKLSGDLPAQALEDVVVPLAREGLIDGVSGISPVSVEKVTAWPADVPQWQERPPGVAGFALRDRSRAFVERLAKIRDEHQLQFDIIAMGGVTTAADVAEYIRLGAAAVQMATAAVCNPGVAEEAYLDYQFSVQAQECWDGVVLELDPDEGTFWARLVDPAGVEPDEEAQFETSEVRQHQRDEIRPGALFVWRTTVLEEGGELVRRSSLRFQKPPPLTDADRRSGRALAERVASAFGPKPDLAVD